MTAPDARLAAIAASADRMERRLPSRMRGDLDTDALLHAIAAELIDTAEDAPNVYRTAWSDLQRRVNDKTGWGKNELHALMAACLQVAVDEAMS